MEDLSKTDDAELVEMLRSGSDAAFMEIYERYQALLFAYGFRKLQDKQEAQDVVQDVFVKLWEKRGDFILKTCLSGFLYKSVLNRILDVWKHNKVVREHADLKQLHIDVDSVQTDYLIREKEIATMIAKEIAGMPPRMREVYEMKHVRFQGNKAIAEQLGISEHTVSNQLKSASARLKKNLGAIIFIVYIMGR